MFRRAQNAQEIPSHLWRKIMFLRKEEAVAVPSPLSPTVQMLSFFCCPPPSLLSLFVYTTNRTYYWSASIAISKHRLVTLLYAYALHFTWALPNIRTSFPPPSHQYTYYATMKLSTAATAMIVSVTVLSLPATVTASTSKTSKQTKGGSYSMSATTTPASNSKSKQPPTPNPKHRSKAKVTAPVCLSTSKASKNAKGGSYSYSMSVGPDPDFPCCCNLTKEERASQIRELMSTVSDPSHFDDPSTPQARALDWITNEDAIEPVLCPNEIGNGCSRGGTVNPLIQRYVLTTFYFGTNGENWNDSEGWLTERMWLGWTYLYSFWHTQP